MNTAYIAADVSEERLGRFFTKEGETYRVERKLREQIVFANHSVLRDPPFSEFDLISCRNLLTRVTSRRRMSTVFSRKPCKMRPFTERLPRS